MKNDWIIPDKSERFYVQCTRVSTESNFLLGVSPNSYVLVSLGTKHAFCFFFCMCERTRSYYAMYVSYEGQYHRYLSQVPGKKVGLVSSFRSQLVGSGGTCTYEFKKA